MYDDNLYRLIPEDGKHLANSRNNENAFRGVYLDDETNRPSGAGEFIKVENSEEVDPTDSCNPIELAVISVVCVVAGAVAHAAWPHIKHWFQSTVIHRVPKDNSGKQAELSVYPNKTDAPPICSCDLDEAMNQYEKNMSSTEAQLHLFNIWYHSLCIARECRALSNAVITNNSFNEEQFFEQKSILEKIVSEKTIQAVNRILELNPSLVSALPCSDLFYAEVDEHTNVLITETKIKNFLEIAQ